MPLNTHEKGRRAEDIACSFLEQNGYRIVERNHHGWGGEVDIIAEKDGVLVFVEVKSGKTFRDSSLVSKVSRVKMKRISMATRHYLSVNEITETPIRWDIITVGQGKVNHIESAFTMDCFSDDNTY